MSFIRPERIVVRALRLVTGLMSGQSKMVERKIAQS